LPGRRVVGIGANGQLGTDLVDALDRWDLVPLTHGDIEICDYPRTQRILESVRPDYVINTAAFVRVDACEEQVEQAFAVNAFAVRNLAQVCAGLGSALVDVSTDYVFDGKKREPYTEEDIPNPINVYGNSKLAGEHFVRAICPRHLVVRTSGLYGRAWSHGKVESFVETMIRLARSGKSIRVVDDQVLAPTYTRDLAEAMAVLLAEDAHGLIHVTNRGACSWYEFAKAIFAIAGVDATLEPSSSADMGRPAQRPAFSVLARAKPEEWRLAELRPWAEALREYLQERDTPSDE